MSQYGYVYILSNPSMPGLLKIGRSISGGRKRAREIDGTGVPTPFVLEWEMYVDDPIEMEVMAHDSLDQYRINSNREFFKVDLHEAVAAIMSEYAGSLGYTVSPVDFIVPENAISWYTHQLNEVGLNVIGPEVATALCSLPVDIVIRAVAEWNKRIAKRRALKNENKPTLQAVQNG